MSRRGRNLVFRRVARVDAGVRKAPASHSERGIADKLALFGWLRGTVAMTGDPTEPADLEWAKRIDDEHSSVA